jgi:outer membrane protein
MKIKITLLIILIAFGTSGVLFAQDTLHHHVLTLQLAFKLALDNSYQLKISKKQDDFAMQETAIARLNKLPEISTDLNYGYISNADIYSPTFSKHEVGLIPHQFTQFSVLAEELVFKGGAVRNSIKKSELREQIASLSLENDQQDIKFLVAAKYLDIYRLIDQRQVYINNIMLAQQRLKNVLTMRRQGLVTENDVLRTKLTISDFELSLRTTNNDITILNQQLNMVTGLADSTRLVPDSTLLIKQPLNREKGAVIEKALLENHELKIAALENKIAENNINLIKSEKSIQVGLYAGSNMQRPFLYNIPAIDIFYNIWQAGIAVHYNISSLYKTPQKIKAGNIDLDISREKEILTKQRVEVEVSANYIKYNEAKDNLKTLTSDLLSAQENYRIVEKKYFNQLALLTDMIDATNTKIEAEIKVTNAQINVVYTYCKLLKTIGTL